MSSDQSVLEPIMSNSESIIEFGNNAYGKPATGLNILRETIMGRELFDYAFKVYANRWKFKHPTPEDFFRTMENVSGENLAWFWRSWFLNNWKFDQAIKSVKYVKGDASNGAIITIENLERMPLPVIVEIKTVNDKVKRITLPVEVWQRNVTWSFKVDTNEELDIIKLDPDAIFPDNNEDNNLWIASKNGVEKVENLDVYLGKFSSKMIPIKIEVIDEDGTLVINADGQPSLPMVNEGNGKFTMKEAGVSVQYDTKKETFALDVSGQIFEFAREK
jgi:hypothetical protein